MYVSDLHGDLFRAARTICPHETSPIPKVRDRCPVRYLILHSPEGLEREGMMGIAPHIDIGMTVSQAPASAVNSTSIHSAVDGLNGVKLAVLASV